MQMLSVRVFIRSIVAAVVAVLTLACVKSANAQSHASIARAASQVTWSDPSIDELRRLFRDAATVKEFLHQLDTRGSRMAPEIIADVREYKLLDLAGDGRVELVAVVDITGRAFFNNIEIVYSRPTGFVVRELRGFDIQSLDRSLVDLDRNGALEILVPQPLEPYQGGTIRPATLVEIYAWNGQEYEKASGRFPSYYSDVILPPLQRELARLEQSSEDGLTTIEREKRRQLQATYRSEIDAAKRRIAEKDK